MYSRETDSRIQIAIEYAKSFIGVPYKWGGNNPVEGMDCSGFVQEILASVGWDPKGDQTAQMLFNLFEQKHFKKVKRQAGAVAFFGKNPFKITHVAFCLNDYCMIEAGGGNSKTHTKEDAAKQNAFVRIRPIHSRAGLIATILPFLD